MLNMRSANCRLSFMEAIWLASSKCTQFGLVASGHLECHSVNWTELVNKGAMQRITTALSFGKNYWKWAIFLAPSGWRNAMLQSAEAQEHILSNHVETFSLFFFSSVFFFSVSIVVPYSQVFLLFSFFTKDRPRTCQYHCHSLAHCSYVFCPCCTYACLQVLGKPL